MNFNPDWGEAVQGDNEYDNLDFMLDLGCGRVPKGRIGIDGRVDKESENLIQLDLNTQPLPFKNYSIGNVISHHCLEHIGTGFINLMDECYRIMMKGSIFRIIVPLFPSRSAVDDADHVRYFTEETFGGFCGADNGDHWHESFSVPYTSCRFKLVDQIATPPEQISISDLGGSFNIDDLFRKPRELRVALEK